MLVISVGKLQNKVFVTYIIKKVTAINYRNNQVKENYTLCPGIRGTFPPLSLICFLFFKACGLMMNTA